MAKGHLVRVGANKREISKAAKYVREVMRRNKLSRNKTARLFGVNPAIVDRLLKCSLTYVPMGVRAELENAKHRAEMAKYRVKEAREQSLDVNIVRLRLEDNKREREWLESLLKVKG